MFLYYKYICVIDGIMHIYVPIISIGKVINERRVKHLSAFFFSKRQSYTVIA